MRRLVMAAGLPLALVRRPLSPAAPGSLASAVAGAERLVPLEQALVEPEPHHRLDLGDVVRAVAMGVEEVAQLVGRATHNFGQQVEARGNAHDVDHLRAIAEVARHRVGAGAARHLDAEHRPRRVAERQRVHHGDEMDQVRLVHLPHAGAHGPFGDAERAGDGGEWHAAIILQQGHDLPIQPLDRGDRGVSDRVVLQVGHPDLAQAHDRRGLRVRLRTEPRLRAAPLVLRRWFRGAHAAALCDQRIPALTSRKSTEIHGQL